MIWQSAAFLRRYLLNILIGIDQLLNCFLAGYPDETISSRLGKAQNGYFGPYWQRFWSPAALLVNVIFFPFDGWDHCRKSIEHDEGKRKPAL